MKDDNWPESWSIFDDKTGIRYPNPSEMRAAWGWKRRVSEDARHFIRWRILERLNDVRWWFLHRFHPRHRLHVIKPNLKPGYHSADKRIEAAISYLFINWVETFKPFDVYDTENVEECGEEYVAEWARIKGLYAYFKGIDPENPPWDDWSDFVKGEPRDVTLARNKKNDAAYDVFTNNLCDVIRFRHHF